MLVGYMPVVDDDRQSVNLQHDALLAPASMSATCIRTRCQALVTIDRLERMPR